MNDATSILIQLATARLAASDLHRSSTWAQHSPVAIVKFENVFSSRICSFRMLTRSIVTDLLQHNPEDQGMKSMRKNGWKEGTLNDKWIFSKKP